MNRIALEQALEDATQDLLDLTSIVGGEVKVDSEVTNTSTPAKPQRGSLSSRRPDLPTPSPLRLTSPVHAWPKGSLLTPIHSPTDIKPSTSTSTSRLSSTDQASENQDEDQDQNLPSAGLAANTDSIREFRTGTPIILSKQEEEDEPAEIDADGQNVGRDSTPNKKKRFLTVGDVYLNEFGERVVEGKVIGKSFIGGRRRPLTPQSATSTTPTSAQESALLEGESFEQIAAEAGTSRPSIERHGQDASRTSTPPAFFLQSFPDSLNSGIYSPISRPSSPLKPTSKTPLQSLSLDDSSDKFLTPSTTMSEDLKVESSDLSRSSSSSRVASPSPKLHRRELSSPGPVPLALGRSSASAATVTSTQSAPLVLHANRRQALKAGVDPSQVASTSFLSSKSQPSTSKRRTKYADEGVTTAPLPLDDDDPNHEHSRSARRLASNANALERTASLFFTPLVQGKQGAGKARIEPDRDREDQEGLFNYSARKLDGTGVSASEPSSPVLGSRSTSFKQDLEQRGIAEEDEHDDAASLDSLLSLPVSIHTNASNGSSSPSSARSRELHPDGEGALDWNSDEEREGGPSVARRRSIRSGAKRSQGKSKVDPDDLFAKEVRIRGWTEVGEMGEFESSQFSLALLLRS